MSKANAGFSRAWDRRRVIAGALALAPVLWLPGCAVPGQKPPPRQFRLTPKSTFPADLPQVDWSLVVDSFDAARSLDTDRIAILRSGRELQYYADATWEARAPVMVQRLLVESFQNSGGIAVTGDERSGLRPNYVLNCDLREFQTDYENTELPAAEVRIDARLVRMPRRQVVDTADFAERAPAPSNRIEDIVSAFDQALGKVFKRLVTWTLESGQADSAAA